MIGCLSPAAWFDLSFALPAPVLENLPLLAVIHEAGLWWYFYHVIRELKEGDGVNGRPPVSQFMYTDVPSDVLILLILVIRPGL